MEEPFGERLLIHLIDERAAAGHRRPYASIPKTANVSDGFQDITYAIFANAVNRTARWLLQHLNSSGNQDVIAYLGPADLRYHVLSMAAVKSGHLMFFPSSRNTVEAFESLFTEARVAGVITTSSPAANISSLVTKRGLQHVFIPSLEELLDEAPVSNIPVHATFYEWRFRPWILLHTSGSTGLPKVVPVKHGMISVTDTFQLVPESNLMPRIGHMRVFLSFPPFHIAGINFSLPTMAWVDGTFVLPPAGVPLTAELIHSIHVHGDIQHSMLAPSLVADLTKHPEYFQGLTGLTGLTFAGGPLSKEAADLVSSKVTLYSTIGATEYGGMPQMSDKDAEDYNFFKFNEELVGAEFRESEQPSLFELVFIRKTSKLNSLAQAIFVTFPELDEYHTKDVFSKHPTKPNLWKYEARLDDVIVFSNGEKLNPIPMEGTITTCPAVKGCLVVGQGRLQSALLVEPKDDTSSHAELLQALDSYIDKANQSCPPYGKLSKDLVFIVGAGKQLPRAPKGTIQRSRANALFKDEISTLYDRLNKDQPLDDKMTPKIDLSTPDSVENFLRRSLASELGVDDLSTTADLFDLGLDSLQVMNLVRAVNLSLPPSAPRIDQLTVYHNSSIAKLTAVLLPVPAQSKKFYNLESDSDEEDKIAWTEMEKVYQDLREPNNRGAAHKKAGIRSTRRPPIFQPDGGLQAWLQVLASFLINLNNWGLVNSFGVFQAYYASTLFPTKSASSIAWIGTLQGTLLLVVGVVSGPLFDMGFFRVILAVATVGVVLGMMMLSLATEYYQALLAQGLLIGLSLGFSYIPSVALIPLYFKKWRGTALGLATAGGSVGGIIYPIVFARLLTEVGFAWACRVIGFIALVTLSAALLLIRPVGARSMGTRQLLEPGALSDLPYVTFLCGSFVFFCGVLVPFIVVTSFARTVTQDNDLAFYCATVLNAAQLLGRVIPSSLSDWSKRRFVPGPELMFLCSQIMAGILAFCWTAVNNVGGYIAWLCVYGFFSGMNVSLAPVVLPHVCPNMAVLGTRLGMLYAVAGVGYLISGPVALAANEASGGYLGSQVWTGACCIGGACFYTITAREAWRRRRLYESRKLRY